MAQAAPRLAVTKFGPPMPPRTVVPRIQPAVALDGLVQRHPVTLVAALAGAGKTVLLTEWVRNRPEGSWAWLTCDVTDADSARFWTSVVAACAHLGDGIRFHVNPAVVGSGESTARDANMAATESGQHMSASYDEPTGWTGWITFAGVMLIIGGSLNLLYGIVAAVNDDWAVWTNTGAVYLDLSEWGWAHIILGSIVLFSGIGVFSGNIAARTVGVIVASISLLVNFVFIPVFPLWAITVIVIDILVIWALTAHGREMRQV
jgi:hypothetical protein